MLKTAKNETVKKEGEGEGGPCVMNLGDVKFRGSRFGART